MHAAIAREIAATGRPARPPACIITGGETTVTIKGDGLGGRNQEFVLAAALEIAGLDRVVVFSAGTDGTDGPTDAAGAIADGQTLARKPDARAYPRPQRFLPLLRAARRPGDHRSYQHQRDGRAPDSGRIARSEFLAQRSHRFRPGSRDPIGTSKSSVPGSSASRPTPSRITTWRSYTAWPSSRKRHSACSSKPSASTRTSPKPTPRWRKCTSCVTTSPPPGVTPAWPKRTESREWWRCSSATR